MDYFFRKTIRLIFLTVLLFSFCGCNKARKAKAESSVSFAGLDFTETVPVSFAGQFTIKKTAGYSVINISGEKPVLVVEKDFPLPSGVPANYVVLVKPLLKTYLVSSSAFDFFAKLNILDKVKFSGSKKENMFLPEVRQYMEDGKITYAGKYSAPDFETLYAEGTDISIQNTMIFHKPEIKEKLEQLKIPVIVEKSSYEKNPLGRIEWIKLYGLLYDKEKEAEDFFNARQAEFNSLNKSAGSRNTIAFFYFTSSGSVNVRKPGDYITTAIAMAGGTYFMDAAADNESVLSTMNMLPEDFYVKAKDADILIYNSTIEGMIEDRELLLQKFPLLKDFKGFKNGRLYCTDKKLFQETTGSVGFMQDLVSVMNHKEENLHYLIKIK